jgi:hypothetical protein
MSTRSSATRRNCVALPRDGCCGAACLLLQYNHACEFNTYRFFVRGRNFKKQGGDFLFDILPWKRLLKSGMCDNAQMKIIRIIAMVMLAFLYLGGTYSLLAGGAFPLIGSGNKAYADFKGMGKDPVIPTISPRRHMPMVKLITVSPAVPVNQPEFGELEKSETPLQLCSKNALIDFSFLSNADRAPPVC